MSKQVPNQEQPEEIDLGQLFKLIGRAFDRLFKFFGSLFNGLFLAFVWIVFFVKKHFIVLAVFTIMGFAYGFFKLKFSEPVFSTNAVIKQNYDTGESLYNLLNYYNDLILDSDTISISTSLGITPKEASNLISFSIESVLNENSKLKVFDKFKKQVDSTVSAGVDFETFLQNSSDYDYEYQRLTVKTKSKSLPRKILPKVIENIVNIEFFQNEQKKDLAELTLSEEAILTSLKESDSLKKVYENVLQKDEVFPNSQTNFTINNAEDKSTTKEFELFTKNIDLRKELVTIKRKKEDIQNIVEVISSQQDEGIIENSVKIWDKDINYKYFYAFLGFSIAFLVSLFIAFLKFLDRFKDKV